MNNDEHGLQPLEDMLRVWVLQLIVRIQKKSNYDER